ncbi:MAG TPA: hypothetical protein ENH84_00165 [Phycisphaerae bacterium]|nr:hypothetical protein [Phycisphaerae bacterium]
MKHLWFLILTLGWFVLSGCPPPAVQEGPSTSAGLMPTAAPGLFGGQSTPGAVPNPVYIIHIRLGIVEVPVGVASGSDELWSYLDEEPVSMQSSMLSRNGFRIGVGRSDTWEDLKQILQKMTGQHFRSMTIQTVPGNPVSVELKTKLPVQRIFTSFEDQTLSGAEYPPGDNLLALSCTLDENDPSKVLLTAVPQIRSTKRVSQFVRSKGIARFTLSPIIFTFTPLTFQLTVPRNDFLVIAPGIKSRRTTSVAYHFLTNERKGMRFETVLVLRPLVHRLRVDEKK